MDGEESFTLHANPSVKRYNVGRFDNTEMPEFQEWKQPVMMLREVEKEEEEELEDPEELQAGNPKFRKKIRRRRKQNRTPGWVLADGNAQERLVGSLEGGISSAAHYMVLMQTSDSEWSMVPVEKWFRFKKPLGYRTLTLEEAEDMANEKKRNVERWMMKHKVAGSKLSGENDSNGHLAAADDVTSTLPRVRTGATLVAKSSIKAKELDLFHVEEKKKGRRGGNASGVAKEGDPTGEDGGDFEEKFSDDESDAEMTGAGAAVGVIDSDSEDEMDSELLGKELSSTGQAMKDLLKRHAKKEDDGDNSSSSSSEEQDATTTTTNGEDGEYVIKHDLGGNVIRVKVEEKKSEGSTANGTTMPAVQGKKRGIDEVGEKSKGAAVKKQVSSAKASAATGASASASTAASTDTGLTEKALQQQLIRYGGRMKTRDLLKKFKKHINTDDDKALFRDILRTICDVHTDPIDGRMLVLKTHFM